MVSEKVVSPVKIPLRAGSSVFIINGNYWIPAFAGMTIVSLFHFFTISSRIKENPVFIFLSSRTLFRDLGFGLGFFTA